MSFLAHMDKIEVYTYVKGLLILKLTNQVNYKQNQIIVKIPTYWLTNVMGMSGGAWTAVRIKIYIYTLSIYFESNPSYITNV